MNWQPWATAAVVAFAVFYLGWKLFAPKRARPKPKGPDVPLSKLTRRSGKSRE